MKKVIVSLCFIISTIMCVGLVAQNNDTKVDKLTENLVSPAKPDSISINKWTNNIERFVGVWSLERTIADTKGAEKKVHPGTFMIVHPNASYTIFVYTEVGAVITSQGNIIIQSPDVYIEIISEHVNSSLIGMSNRINYKLSPTYLHKSFWIEKDRHGGDYKRKVDEVWKRATKPVGEYDRTVDFPI